MANSRANLLLGKSKVRLLNSCTRTFLEFPESTPETGLGSQSFDRNFVYFIELGFYPSSSSQH